MGSEEGAQAYKLDEASEWIEWAEMVDLTMSIHIISESASEARLGMAAHLAMGRRRSAHAAWLSTGATYLDQVMSLWSSRIAWPVQGCHKFCSRFQRPLDLHLGAWMCSLLAPMPGGQHRTPIASGRWIQL